MDRTKIQWSDTTWNPVRGCSRVSEGCRHCYAEVMAARFSDHGQPYHGLAERTPSGPRWTGEVRLVPERLGDPLRWRKPRRIFVNSMSDLFHERLSNEDIAAVFGVMAASPQHTFQVLTKRPERMRKWFRWADAFRIGSGGGEGPIAAMWESLCCTRGRLPASWDREEGPPVGSIWPLPNMWLGVSVEDQATADARIPALLATPAAVRFVSYEPALGPVDFTRWLPVAGGGSDAD